MKRFLVYSLGIFCLLGIIGIGSAFAIFLHYGKGLPDYRQLADYEPPIMTRVHAGDGRLIAEFARQQRAFVPIEAIPDVVKQAFISAEDQHFYEHFGVDVIGIARAVVTNLKNLGRGRRPVGASTITQQVAKNFLLTNETSLERKIKEAILAIRIEKAFSKAHILELYLNEIYLGFGSYGVAAAALNYFDKSLDELTLADATFLAGLPKAPNNYHPIRKPVAAKQRRDYVIGRMLEDGFISKTEAERAMLQPIEVTERTGNGIFDAAFFAEEVRRELMDRYGESGLYEGGLAVHTTLDPHLQSLAQKALRNGLVEYDRRHGWRGAEMHLETVAADWKRQLDSLDPAPWLAPWQRAVVLGLDDKTATIGVEDGTVGTIPLAELKWAREYIDENRRGPAIKKPGDVLTVGDIVPVEAVTKDDDGNDYPENSYALRQAPKVDGGLVAIDPHTGRVLAMAGGFSFARSQFNRVTQALRQPGSAFKPFIYLAALEHGFTPATRILDAPFVIDQGAGLGKWKPANYSNKFYGPSTMRLGIEKSRNLMTVRLAQTLGMDVVSETAKRFGVVRDMQETLAASLGSVETTLMQMTTGYAMLVNGGKRITPNLIDRIQDRNGKIVFRHDDRECAGCQATEWQEGMAPPRLPDTREQVTSPESAYQIVSMLHGVVERGTGVKIRSIGKPIGGKTGTTNDFVDAWFVGFSPDLAVGVYTGFDEPSSLGRSEAGSAVAVPIFRDFMRDALEGQPGIPFRVPPGIRLVRIDGKTGRIAGPGDKDVILEAFKPNTSPTEDESLLISGVQTEISAESPDDSPPGISRPTVPRPSAGGLY
jgi:penicillin-binding protein 1A